MQRVIIESPYAGNIQMNERYARTCLRDSITRGEAPFASHLLYTQPDVLADSISAERRLGIACGQAWLAVADLVAVYTDHGISNGMQQGIDAAVAAGIPVVYRSCVERNLPED